MLSVDDVELEFTDGALSAIAKLALERKSGARGLRAIIEKALLDTMFDLPGQNDVAACHVTGDVITAGAKPQLTRAAHSARTLRSKKPAALPEEKKEAPDAV